jgi:hypothetical protein
MMAKATLSVESIRRTRYQASFRDLFTQITEVVLMLLILALLLVLILFGAGFAVHVLWILAAVFLVLWLVGFAIGRGEGAGSHRFYRW